MISFIMMAKNVANYIMDSIKELQKESKIKWELIVVEDNSEDSTYEVVKEIASKDNRIKLYRNPFNGKVLGTNFGFTKTSGDIIKCIDSDDILLIEFFHCVDQLANYDAHIHSLKIVDNNLNFISLYNSNPLIISESFEFVASNLISIPKSCWSFKRSLAEKVFPIPIEMPFEDVWISTLVKKHANDIIRINKPLYLYRQHLNQTFGGILNFSAPARIFRAKRMLVLIDLFSKEERILSNSMLKNDSFDKEKEYYQLLSQDKIKFRRIFFSDLNLIKIFRLFIHFYIPGFATLLIKLKWYLDAFKN